jgi:hypothetical protein
LKTKQTDIQIGVETKPVNFSTLFWKKIHTNIFNGCRSLTNKNV